MTDTPTEREDEGAWGKLRRRKVVQWGIAYAASAWGLLQVLDYLSGTFEWPLHVQKLATLAALIGVPIVLVLAWYHGGHSHGGSMMGGQHGMGHNTVPTGQHNLFMFSMVNDRSAIMDALGR